MLQIFIANVQKLQFGKPTRYQSQDEQSLIITSTVFYGMREMSGFDKKRGTLIGIFITGMMANSGTSIKPVVVIG
jgi:hypothetical protein